MLTRVGGGGGAGLCDLEGAELVAFAEPKAGPGWRLPWTWSPASHPGPARQAPLIPQAGPRDPTRLDAGPRRSREVGGDVRGSRGRGVRRGCLSRVGPPWCCNLPGCFLLYKWAFQRGVKPDGPFVPADL